VAVSLQEQIHRLQEYRPHPRQEAFLQGKPILKQPEKRQPLPGALKVNKEGWWLDFLLKADRPKEPD
jgi:hypothetical protein